jgi:hypothetical protein
MTGSLFWLLILSLRFARLFLWGAFELLLLRLLLLLHRLLRFVLNVCELGLLVFGVDLVLHNLWGDVESGG